MSKPKFPSAVIEWSPDGCIALASEASHARTGADITDVVQGIDGSRIILGIARTSCFIRTLTIPLASKHDTELLIRNRLSSLFPISTSELAYDFAIYSQNDHKTQVILIAAMRADLLREVRKQAEVAGIKISAIVPSALSASAITSEVGINSASLIQNLDSGLAIDIVKDGVLRYSRIVSRTEDPEAEIERTFTAAGTDCYPTISVGDAYARADHFVTRGTLNTLLKTDLSHLPLNLELNEIKLARTKAAQQLTIRNASIGLLGSFIFARVVAYTWMGRVNNVKLQTSKLNTFIASLQSHKSKVDKVWKSESPIVDLINHAYKPAQRFSDILTIIAEDAPKSIWIKSFNIQRGTTFTLQGVAMNSSGVSQFVRKLSSEKRFRNIQLLFANNTSLNKVSVVQFSISGFSVGNIPLTQKNNGLGN